MSDDFGTLCNEGWNSSTSMHKLAYVQYTKLGHRFTAVDVMANVDS